MPETPCFTTLYNRGLVTVSGPDSSAFLQNLITNDIRLLERQDCLYACLLTPQGKFLHDFFITRDTNGAFLLDCEGGARAHDLLRRLSLYKLRADVDLVIQPEHGVYALLDADNASSLSWPDPRHKLMGRRSFEKPVHLEETAFEDWDKHRIMLCVPDGSRDLTVESSTMDEARMDRLNAIDYNKGCYVGQELTARMHYRGLGKKHLYAVRIAQDHLTPLDDPSVAFKITNGLQITTIGGEAAGELRSRCGDVGLALLKDSFLRS